MAALAKISRPKLHRAFPRTRLFRLLDHAQERALTWVCAPPGAGKTVLVASHLQARKLPGVWYQVDPGDSDPATFFHYLSWAAPRRRQPLPLLTPEYLPDLPGFARRYFRDLFIRLPQPATLVLDNYQEAAEASPLHTILREALNEIPDELRMIVISRTKTPRDGPPGSFWKSNRYTAAE
jgi:ATP/maltotriose-dependent transcriptional regulator MalT